MKNLNRTVGFAGIYLLLFIAYVFIMPHSGHMFDISYWRRWSEYIFLHGLGKVYETNTDYLPGMHYIFYLFGKAEGSINNIDKNIYQLKIFILPFDFLAGFYLVKLIKEKFHSPLQVFFYSLFFFLNIFYLYNTLIWGQVDSVFTAFALISLYYALKEKALLSLLSIVLAINFKLQAIVFAPLIGILLLPLLLKNFNAKKLVTWIVVPLIFQLLILLPFFINGDMDKVWNAVTGSVGKFPVVSPSAFNMWHWLKQGALNEASDEDLFWGVTYKHWGLILFFIALVAALFPLAKDVFKTQVDTDKALLAGALIPLAFFFFNTQMHERYSHPAVLFMAVWAIRNRKFIPYILVSAAYFFNLESQLQFLQLKNYHTLIFNEKFVAALFFIVIVWLYVELYRIDTRKRAYSVQ